jgi:Tfp pilus assembly protein PilF
LNYPNLEKKMQYKTKLNRSLIRIALGVSICMIAVATFAVTGNAQTDTSSGATETRARRAPAANGTASPSEPIVESTAMNGVASNPQTAMPDKGGIKVDSGASKDQAKLDRVGLLRTQILDAKTDVERVRLQRTLVDYLIALGRPSEAAIELRAMLTAENLDAATYYNIGNGLARLDNKEQAVVAYRKAIDTRQGNYSRALNNLGVVLLDLGRTEEAYDAFMLAIKQQNFRYAEASFNLGKLYATQNEADLAISEWQRALAVQPDHIDAAIALARAYAVTGKPERGLELIDVTLKRTGGNSRLESVREEIASNGSRN